MPQRKSKWILLGGAAIGILFVTPLVFGVTLLIGIAGWLGGISNAYCDNSTNPMSATLSLGTSKGAAERYFSQFAPADRAERERNAGIIIAVGRSRGLSDRTISIAVATAIQESGLRNLAYGDRDSLGLFQQRPSQGWGTPAQIMDPKYAAGKFYDELVKISDRDSRPMIDVAIQVQRPDPYFYRRDWDWQREQAAPDMVANAPKNTAVDTIAVAPDDKAVICQNLPTAHIDASLIKQPTVIPGSKIRGDDYPYASYPTGIGSPLGYLYRECVDFVAWRLNEQSGLTNPLTFKFKGYGNAADWKGRLVAAGYRADNTPIVGAVVWWGPNAGDASLKVGELGHVAIVSAVNADGSIVIEQYNVLPYADHRYNAMTLPASYLHNVTFIHVADTP